MLDSISRIHPCAGFILLGDFNHLNDSTIRSYPLKQVVKCATRKSAILDKIYTNIAGWYDQPFSTPPIGKSHHNYCIVMVPLLVAVISIMITLAILYSYAAMTLMDKYSCLKHCV